MSNAVAWLGIEDVCIFGVERKPDATLFQFACLGST